MIIKPSINFLTKYSDEILAQAIATILVAMTDNSVYPNPLPTLLAVRALLDAFINARARASKGGPEETVVKNAKRLELTNGVRLLAIYVAGACGNDLANLMSSGFPIQKPTRSRVGMLAAPLAPVTTQGSHSGTLDAKTAAVLHGTSYMWRIAKASAPEVILQMHPATKASFSFTGLTTGEIYLVTVAAVGAAGVSEWSNPGQRMVI